MRPERWLLLLGLTVCPPLPAATDGTPPAPATTPDDKARETETTIEMLEFLGSWETATGPWNESMPDKERAQPARRPKENTRD